MPIYMQFPNAKGSATAQGFQGWIELNTAGFGMDRPMDNRMGSASYAATGKLQVHPISISKNSDAASPTLMIAAIQGAFDKTVKIAFTTQSSSGSQTQLLAYELTNCGISRVMTQAGTGGLPSEDYVLSFGQIQFTFNAIDQSGHPTPTITGYDLERAVSL